MGQSVPRTKSDITKFIWQWHRNSFTSFSTNSHIIMDQIVQFVEPVRQFAKDSVRLVKRCTKPDKKEFQKIAIATAIGFAIMGFIGFFVKLIHIPINNIIVGSQTFYCYSFFCLIVFSSSKNDTI